MPIEYLGSKARILEFVVAPMLGDRAIRSVADVFCGTGAVSRALGIAGRRVVASDHLALCVTLAEASLLPSTPDFVDLRPMVRPRPRETTYAAALRQLQDMLPTPGFIHATYSPASAATCSHERRYFTEENAARIDTIRDQITAWEEHLTRAERAVLLRDLVIAASRVSNTAGTYGCFLREFKQRALEPLRLVPRADAPAGRARHEVHRLDAAEAASAEGVDAVYLDPPYTKRQYAAYYHVLETVVAGDEPEVDGVTGLRPWHDHSSDFCHRRRAPEALRRVLAGVRARCVFLSYSDDGHIEHEEIVELLGERGRVTWSEQPLRRYRSSRREHRSDIVTERLYALKLS